MTIAPTSAAQVRAARDGVVPDPERLDASTFVIPMPTGIPLVPTVFCYLLVDRGGDGYLVDPGAPVPGAAERLQRAVADAGVARIRACIATHGHIDHLGLVAEARTAFGAEYWASRVEPNLTSAPWRDRTELLAALEEWGVPDDARADLVAAGEFADADVPEPDLALNDGDALPIPGRTVRVVATPGHTPGHLCFVDDGLEGAGAERRLFAGDHLLPHLVPGIGLGSPFDENPVDAGLASLERLRELGDVEVLPGHGYRYRGLEARIAQIRAHHESRTAEVRTVLAEVATRSIWEVATRLTWSAGWEGMRGFRRLSALGQTELHVERVRALT